ncbi:MAG: hypothetical protein A3C35_08090 [Omnitrophica bacterium RIFCSPHIGHO2_02_FULL_46_11]|nr:MAG: hypothetical protein A3C35_08090 [Omnitrophica bacterium RIFCSPHIGHO2_02_FULL_46_11]
MVSPLMKQKLFLIVFLLSLLPLNLFASEHQQVEQLVDRVVAVVNKEIITQSEFDVLFRPFYEQIKKAYQGPNLQGELESIRLKLLNQMIEDKLVYQEAQKLGITVEDVEVDDEIAAFKQQFPKGANFEKEMENSGLTIDDIKKRFRERLSIEKLHQSVIRGRVVVSPPEAEQYFKEHPEEFTQKERVKVFCITIRKNEEAIKKGTMDEAAKKKTESLLKDLKRGADFEKLAMQNSQDTHADQGGYVGFVQRGDMVSNIDQVLFSLPPGSISDVLETEYGYHVFKVIEKQPAFTKTFEQAKDEITEKLFRAQAHQRFIEWMDDLKKKSYISVR